MPLLRVSKKTHNEASHIFWSTNTFDVILTDREAFIDVNYKDADRLDGRSSRNYLNIAAIPLHCLKLIRRLCVASSTHTRKITGRDMVQ